MASSSSCIPLSRRPALTSVSPSRLSAYTSRSLLPALRAMSMARRVCAVRSSRSSACRARSMATQPWPSHSAPATARSARASQPRAAEARPESRYWCETQTPTRPASSHRPASA